MPSVSGGFGEAVRSPTSPTMPTTPPASTGGGESNRYNPLAGVIPAAPTGTPKRGPAQSDPYQAPSGTLDAGFGGGPSFPSGTSSPPRSSAYSPYVAPAPAPYEAPAPAPYVAPASVPYVAPAPAPEPRVAPAPAPAPYVAPAPPRPRTPVPSESGSRRTDGRGRPLEGNLADAIEHCRFALRALEHKDVERAAQKLREALQQIT